MDLNLKPDDVVGATGGSVFKASEATFSAIGTDTRRDLKGQLFVALKGEVHDAHKYLAQAIQKGAAGLLIHDTKALPQKLPPDLCVIVVSDTLVGLQKLAHFWRGRLSGKVIGITGSNGKTTTKEFLAKLLSAKGATHKSEGSFNNHWGVPLTLLGANAKHEFIVLEMGMNHLGELKALSEIATPDVVCVTTVGRAHLGEVGSLQQVAEAKEEIYKYAPGGAAKVFNLDNPHTKEMLAKYKAANNMTFSKTLSSANVCLQVAEMSILSLKVKGHIGGLAGEAVVPVFGAQNLENIMAAAALALSCGMTPQLIWKTLPELKSAWGRNQHLSLKNHVQVIFDGYNANPDSMQALFENVRNLRHRGPKWAVLGEMLEMGKDAPKLHEELGRQVGKAGFDGAWFMGQHGMDFRRGVGVIIKPNKLVISKSYEQKLASQILSMIEPGTLLVIKGSRGTRTERFLEYLTQNYG